MKHEPITDPAHHGCGCCPGVPKVLSKDKWLDVGFGEVVFNIEYPNGRPFTKSYVSADDYDDECTMVKDLEEEYADKFKRANCITLFFNTPLHDETYEFNKEDKQWYLINQGRGFA